jgi:uncharacterized protein (UPF0332 family)
MKQSADIQSIIEKSESKLKTARIDFDGGQYDDAVSRAYYAVFHAMTALLLHKGLVFSSHAQTIGAFNQNFIKTGIFPKDFSQIIQSLFEDRQTGDYDVLSKMEKETAVKDLLKKEGAIN